MNNAPRNWRRHRTMTEKENLGLPVPRLEIRYSPFADGRFALYSLVYPHLLSELRQIPLGGTMCTGGRADDPNNLDEPFREGAHILNDMYELGLPGFIVNGDKFRALTLMPGNMSSFLNQKIRASYVKEDSRAASAAKGKK